MMDLLSDFKLTGPIALEVISSFYQAMKPMKDSKATRLFKEWAETFEHIYGGVLKSNQVVNHVEKFAEKLQEKTIKPEVFLFCLYTYYSLIVKLISSGFCRSILNPVNNSIIDQILTSKSLRDELRLIESGDIYKKSLGIDNYLEGDLFSWYLFAWNPVIERGIRNLLKKLEEYDLRKFIIELQNSRDILKALYQQIVPQEIRHDLGEYYTPGWLVEYTVRETGYDGNAKHCVLDPGCGTGPFLVEAIRVYRNANEMKPKEEQLKDILHNIVGFDVNPVAVITAKTNYLLAISDLLPPPSSGIKVSLPIYLTDSVFTPTTKDEFDYIIGNPPWIKWEFLSPEYKEKLSRLYLHTYELFSFTGQKARHGFAHDDISVVFTYIVADKYLKFDGKLGFVLKQTLFTNEANAGFRKFQIITRDKRIPLGVQKVTDMLEIEPFRPYGAETSVAVFIKGKGVTYPVPYVVWHYKNMKNKTTETHTLDDVVNLCYEENKFAIPDPDEKTDNAPWVFIEKVDQVPFSFGEEKNYYKPRHGIVNDLVSVFFVNIKHKVEGGNLLIENTEYSDKRVRKVKKRPAIVKPDLLYICLKSRHVKKWKLDFSSGKEYLIIPQRKAGETSLELEKDNIEVYNYLSEYREELNERSSIHFQCKPFYSVYSVGDYTFKPYKIVWKSMVQEPAFVVVSSQEDEYIGNKLLMPDNPIGYISVDDKDEAHYICGILNSNLLRQFFFSKQRGTKYPVSQAIMEKIPIRKYDLNFSLHKEISALSQEIHERSEQNKEIAQLEMELNVKVGDLFNFSYEKAPIK